MGMFAVTMKAMVMAGLRCPPLVNAAKYTPEATANANPNEMETTETADMAPRNDNDAIAEPTTKECEKEGQVLR